MDENPDRDLFKNKLSRSLSDESPSGSSSDNGTSTKSMYNKSSKNSQDDGPSSSSSEYKTQPFGKEWLQFYSIQYHCMLILTIMLWYISYYIWSLDYLGLIVYEAPNIEGDNSEDDTRIKSSKTSLIYQRNDSADKRELQGKFINHCLITTNIHIVHQILY